MSYKFVPLSSKVVTDVHNELLLVGLFLIYLKHPTPVNIKQIGAFLYRKHLGTFVPAGEEIEDFCGIQQVQGKESDFSRNLFVEYHFIDQRFNGNPFDLIYNLSTVQSPINHVYFHLSDYSTNLKLVDSLAGFIRYKQYMYPVFINYGYVCLKMDSFEELKQNFSYWIDAMYRIIIGEPDSPPSIVFTNIRVIFPTQFPYPYTNTKLPSMAIKPQTKDMSLPWEQTNSNNGKQMPHHQMDQSNLAGAPFHNQTDCCLNYLGQIPAPFPETNRNVHEPHYLNCLPDFIKDILDTKKHVAINRNQSQNPKTSEKEDSHSNKQ